MENKLCQLYNIPYQNESIAKVCTCNFEKEWKTQNITHDSSCPVIHPNFIYYPNSLKIWWYRTFFRNAYCNQKIDINTFEEVIVSCLKSL